MKRITKVGIMTVALTAMAIVGLSSCQKTDELPPVSNKIASGYRMPDPEPLTDADRAVIEAQEKEYEENAN